MNFGLFSAVSRFLPLLAACFVSLPATATASDAELSRAELAKGFQHPPRSARPWVYWFWLNGNITSNGITADLEAMKRVGIGGALIMEVDQGAPVGPVDFMGTAWRGLFRHVHQEATRLGIAINMNDDAGWNGSGGPWIRPEQSMQKVVWTETNVIGPLVFDAPIAQPETVAGFYRDIAVLAFPATATNRIPGIRGKAAYEVAGIGHIERGPWPADATIDPGQLLTLSIHPATQRVTGKLPAGHWTLVRFGHTSTGAENAPAPRTGRGLECDKLSPVGMEAQFDGMMAKLIDDNPSRNRTRKTGLSATHIDSWENGSQNWTTRMREEFRQRRGYDLLPFLPVYTGRVIGSLEISCRFLRDLRQTVSELVIENYASRMRDLAHARGLRFTVEAYGGPCDSIPYAGRSDEPMGEFWTPSGAIETCRAMASAGHVYGKRIIGAEAFTSGDQERWREHPAILKSHGDQAFCEGINRFVFHRYALQPWTNPTRAPGMTMGPWGQHYERTQTWWEWTPAWHEYLARCQFLLRQGLFVADVCYVQPELPPQGPGDHPRDGYAWDECTAEAVLERMSVREDRIVLPDGMSYPLLVLPPTDTMTPDLLRKVKKLVEAGATVLGPKPNTSPSLTDYPACDTEVERLAAELWGACDGQKVREHTLGKGRILWGPTPAQALEAVGIPADFTSSEPLRRLHRRTGTTDLYFVANPRPNASSVTCSFRVTGRRPELWWPDSGRIERAAMYSEDGRRTHVVVPLEAYGSVFVVFRQSHPTDDPVVEIRHDQQELFAARLKPPTIPRILRATYGVPGDGNLSRDVTTIVQTMADAGEFSITVSTLASEGDPAPREIKTLQVEFQIGNQTFTVKGRDTDRIRLADDILQATVRGARYGVLNDPVRTRDVKDRVQRLIEAGETGFQVARMAEGDDPAFLVVKTLELDVLIDGKEVRISGQDPDRIELAPARSTPEPAAQLRRDLRGSFILEPHQGGTFSWTTTSGNSGTLVVSQLKEPLAVEGPWDLEFTEPGGQKFTRRCAQLQPWNEATDDSVRYFSGSATYSISVTIPRDLRSPGHRLLLDLGRVQVMARVKLNGHDLGTLWKPPYTVDITERARNGANRLTIEVVNLWPNRLIGDEQLAEDSERNPDGTLKRWPDWVQAGQHSPAGRTTFTSWRLWKKTENLLPSGLIGPV
ncbi:MAG: hypothetical protein JNK85_07500, partial [Verrucomicrobiales bacterium]|nr:hypothetical protein [Verrucomicrobiales bacterium]